MAIGTVWPSSTSGSLSEQRDRIVPDVEGAVQPSAAPGDGVGGEFAQAG